MKPPGPRDVAHFWKRQAIAQDQRSYRETFRLLREFEGSRAYVSLVIAGLWLLLAPMLTLGAFFAGYVAGVLQQPVWVVVGALLALALPFALERLQEVRPWHAVLSGRLWTFEHTTEPHDLNTLIRTADHAAAERALRHAKLNPGRGATRIQPPPDATDLDLRLIVSRSPCWHLPPLPEIHEQIRDALGAAGIRARVAGIDLYERRPNDQPGVVQASRG